MPANTPSVAAVDDPRVRETFRRIKLLVGAYLAISVATIVVIVLLRNHSNDVNPTAWTRSVIVVASALLTLRFAASAAGGGRRSYLRLRIITIVMPVAIVVLVALPGVLPLWMRLEQAVCGVLLIAVAVLANTGHLRAALADAA